MEELPLQEQLNGEGLELDFCLEFAELDLGFGRDLCRFVLQDILHEVRLRGGVAGGAFCGVFCWGLSVSGGTGSLVEVRWFSTFLEVPVIQAPFFFDGIEGEMEARLLSSGLPDRKDLGRDGVANSSVCGVESGPGQHLERHVDVLVVQVAGFEG